AGSLGRGLLAGVRADVRAVVAHRLHRAAAHRTARHRYRPGCRGGVPGDRRRLGGPSPGDGARRALVHPHRTAGAVPHLGCRGRTGGTADLVVGGRFGRRRPGPGAGRVAASDHGERLRPGIGVPVRTLPHPGALHRICDGLQPLAGATRVVPVLSALGGGPARPAGLGDGADRPGWGAGDGRRAARAAPGAAGYRRRYRRGGRRDHHRGEPGGGPMRQADPDLQRAWPVLAAVRQRQPLVHCITAAVSMGIVADGLLAAGARPMMTETVAEAPAVTEAADALLVNLGTLSTDAMAAIPATVEVTSQAGRPWVLDPTAIGRAPVRTPLARRLLREGPAVVRGNASEMLALAGESDGGRGADSVAAPHEAARAGQRV